MLSVPYRIDKATKTYYLLEISKKKKKIIFIPAVLQQVPILKKMKSVK